MTERLSKIEILETLTEMLQEVEPLSPDYEDLQYVICQFEVHTIISENWVERVMQFREEKLQKDREELYDRVNHMMGSIDWQPLHKSIPQDSVADRIATSVDGILDNVVVEMDPLDPTRFHVSGTIRPEILEPPKELTPDGKLVPPVELASVTINGSDYVQLVGESIHDFQKRVQTIMDCEAIPPRTVKCTTVKSTASVLINGREHGQYDNETIWAFYQRVQDIIMQEEAWFNAPAAVLWKHPMELQRPINPYSEIALTQVWEESEVGASFIEKPHGDWVGWGSVRHYRREGELIEEFSNRMRLRIDRAGIPLEKVRVTSPSWQRCKDIQDELFRPNLEKLQEYAASEQEVLEDPKAWFDSIMGGKGSE